MEFWDEGEGTDGCHQKFMHSPEEVANDPRILYWVMFFPYLSLTSLNGLETLPPTIKSVQFATN